MSFYQVELVRADLKRKNNIVIRGYFTDDCPCTEKLSVQINGQSVFSEFKKNNLNEIRRDYSMHGKDVYEEYIASVDANMPVEKVTDLEVLCDGTSVYKLSGKKLSEVLTDNPISCDAAEIRDGKTYIYGKAPHFGKLEIEVKNQSDCRVTFERDLRLAALYTELDINEAVSFEICFDSADNNACYEVVFNCTSDLGENSITYKKADMKALCTAVLYGAKYGRIERFKRYAKRYGLGAAVSHYLGRAKVHAAPEYTYSDFLKKYYPDMDTELNNSDIITDPKTVLRMNGYTVFAAPGMILSNIAEDEFSKAIINGAKLVYGDEDEYEKKSEAGKIVLKNPRFKSGFSIDYLYGCNYIGFPVAVDNSLLNECGLSDGLDTYDEAKWYDALISLCEKCNDGEIVHIEKILGHSQKRNFFFSDREIVGKHLVNRGIKAEALEGIIPGTTRVKYNVENEPLISVIIPNKDNADILKRCIDSLLKKSDYQNFEILVVENNSTCNETFDYYKEIEKEEKVRVLYYPSGFNFSSINNFAVKEAKGEYLLLLNNDTELLSGESLSEMLSICQQNNVGMTGALLYFPDDTVQHAGVAIGLQGLANHVFSCEKDIKETYLSEAAFIHDMSAVTAACLMMSKKDYDELGGFDEKLTVAFNDVDLCLRIKEAGKRIIYTPNAVFYHYESKSRGHEDSVRKQRREEGEVQRCGGKHEEYLAKLDPYYNKNLTRIYMNASLRR